MMPYRVYCLDRYSRIGLADWIDANSDDEAVAKAHAMKNGAIKCEVWQEKRLVATLKSDLLDPAP